jgi:hypothetical protein
MPGHVATPPLHMSAATAVCAQNVVRDLLPGMARESIPDDRALAAYPFPLVATVDWSTVGGRPDPHDDGVTLCILTVRGTLRPGDAASLAATFAQGKSPFRLPPNPQGPHPNAAYLETHGLNDQPFTPWVLSYTVTAMGTQILVQITR